MDGITTPPADQRRLKNTIGAMTSTSGRPRCQLSGTANLLYTTEIGQYFRFLNENIAPAAASPESYK
ncbi:hypothetical protein [Mesorhizobium sp. AA22]|uniref:hypothetical protein n=1 Tax=Mesorhizobium sp. AA22 TaxID=1854057 RepID=UPI0012E9ADEE|nr:hypothetical protein [Mesorhizobium sp. AA22]QIA24681.1 hypothetical protein A9K68_024925 [Mesorhizobium sp. AA22]